MKSERVLPADVKSDLDRLTAEFFRVVSFRKGEKPPYNVLHKLFVDNGLLIRNSLGTPEISNVSQFIEPRASLVNSGELTSLEEVEIAEITEIFGNVAHRFSAYEKSGTMKGVPFGARGMISTQFVMTPVGWKISAMAWDDERPGLTIPDYYVPAERSMPR
jgi:hypothetical protein